MSTLPRRGFLLQAAAPIAGLLAGHTARNVGLTGSDAIDPREERAMTAAAEAFMAEYDVPALSVAIARADNLVYVSALGMADRAGEVLTPRHRFRIASVSKPITSVAIMSLIEQGKLSLSERIFGQDAVLGFDYGKRPYREHVEEITVEHLLTHTCGGWSNGGPDPDPMFTNPQMDHRALISWTLDNIPIRHTPGEQYAYANFGFCLLGRVVEKRSGVGYEQFVRQNVLRKCAISGMEIAGNRREDRKAMETVYYGQGGESPYGMQVARMDAHGGWLATPTDLVRLLVRVDGFASKPDLLKPETLRAMTTAPPNNPGYARGWMVNPANNWWHNGSLPGTTSIMVRTSGGMCWAALTNTRKPQSQIGLDLDRLVWNMVGKVSAWPAIDLF